MPLLLRHLCREKYWIFRVMDFLDRIVLLTEKLLEHAAAPYSCETGEVPRGLPGPVDLMERRGTAIRRAPIQWVSTRSERRLAFSESE